MLRVASLRAIVLVGIACLTGCASYKVVNGARTYFDSNTGSTWSVVDEPLIFARSRTDVAAYARDYVTLVAIQVDVSAQDHDYLMLYRWSTVDPRFSPPPGPDQGELEILADGREIRLQPLAQLPVRPDERRGLHEPAHAQMRTYAYAVDPSLLRFVAGSRDLTVRMPQESVQLPFTLWGDGRRALARFADTLDGRAQAAP